MSDDADKTGKPKPRRTRPRGSIRQVGPGKFRVRVCVGKNEVTGEYERDDRTIHGMCKDAERVRAGIIRDLDLGIYAPASSATLGEWLDAWLKEQRANVTARTLDGYAGSLDRYIREPLEKKTLASLKASEIQAVYFRLSLVSN